MDGGSGEENRAFSRKKLFSFLKGSKTDAQGIALLKNSDNVYTNDVDKANLLNTQFQSVCSIRAPLNLIMLCHTTNNNKFTVYRKNVLSVVLVCFIFAYFLTPNLILSDLLR